MKIQHVRIPLSVLVCSTILFFEFSAFAQEDFQRRFVELTSCARALRLGDRGVRWQGYIDVDLYVDPPEGLIEKGTTYRYQTNQQGRGTVRICEYQADDVIPRRVVSCHFQNEVSALAPLKEQVRGQLRRILSVEVTRRIFSAERIEPCRDVTGIESDFSSALEALKQSHGVQFGGPRGGRGPK